MAVWALRTGFVGLAAAVVGVILLSAGFTSSVLVLGVVIWVIAAAVTLTGVFKAHQELPEPRPGWWALRLMVIHDAVHARGAGSSS